jgi:hypothetical protein
MEARGLMRAAWISSLLSGARALVGPRSGPLLAAAIGALVSVVGFGPAYVLGTSPFWTYPPTDFSSHLVGWREFVQEPWTFPLLLSKRLDPPEGLDIVFLDSLPLVALVAKALRGIVPDGLRTMFLNPLGWWQVVSYAMQGASAALLARSLGAIRRAQIAAAVVALSMPIFITRFVHTGLGSHFVILLGLWLYVRSREPAAAVGAELREAARWTALLVAALLLHPYLFVMVAGLFFAALVRWAGTSRGRCAALAGGLAASFVALAMVCAGILGARVARGTDWGFGYKSTDLLSFVVPQHSPFFPWRDHRMAIDLAHAEGAEGYDYLGVGLLVLGGILAVRARAAIVAAAARNKALVVVLLGMFLFAVSTRVSIGGHVVLELPVPRSLSWLVGQLRASGRFIWPPTYAAAIYLVVLGFRRWRTGAVRFVTPCLVLVQFVDGMGNFGWVRSYTANAERRWLDWAAFEPVVAAHDGVTFAPSYSCIVMGHGYTTMMHMEIETMAAARGIGLSGVRSSRFLSDCAEEASARLLADVDPERLHVLFPPEVDPLETVHYERYGASCVTFGGAPRSGILCSSKLSHAPLGFVPVAQPIYELGTAILLGTAESSRFLGPGWSFAEGTHRWTVGKRASIYLRADRPLPPGATLRVRAGAAVFPSRPRLTATILVNAVPTGSLVFTSIESQAFSIALPPSAAGATRLELHVIADDQRSPKELGESQEARALAFVVQELAIVAPP